MIRFDGQVAVVTGAGGGLGRAHALGLAGRGAKVVVNELSLAAAEKVAAEIKEAGGEAFALAANVAHFEQVQAMTCDVMNRWGRIDILVNNAGILRDKSFAKMDMADFRLVLDVHLMGSANCTKAVWDIMRAQNYGRIVMTSSASGLYGNFGQSNYGAAKAGVIGLMNVLAIEGAKNNIRVNSLAPTAMTQMTEGLLPPEVMNLLSPETVTPGVLFLVGDDAPTGVILGAGAGCFAVARMVESESVYLSGGQLTPESLAERFAQMDDLSSARRVASAFDQTNAYALKAAKSRSA